MCDDNSRGSSQGGGGDGGMMLGHVVGARVSGFLTCFPLFCDAYNAVIYRRRMGIGKATEGRGCSRTVIIEGRLVW